MPIGGGILPASGSNQYNELTYVTRRAFIPKLVVQIYNQELHFLILENVEFAKSCSFFLAISIFLVLGS